MAADTRVVRAYIYPQLGFDLEVPEHAGDAEIERLVRVAAREAGDWFDTLSPATVLGDGKMTLEFDARHDGATWEEDEDAGGG